jgi:hypothetical protein
LERLKIRHKVKNTKDLLSENIRDLSKSF